MLGIKNIQINQYDAGDIISINSFYSIIKIH